MERNKGFTLIELIVVIVILGILAVTAAPKFIDLQSDARIAALNGLKASVASAYTLVHGKALNAGQDSASAGIIQINGKYYATCNGYPCASRSQTKHGSSAISANYGLAPILDIDLPYCSDETVTTADWCETAVTGENAMKIYIVSYYLKFSTSELPECYVKYTGAESYPAVPKVEVVTSGC